MNNIFFLVPAHYDQHLYWEHPIYGKLRKRQERNPGDFLPQHGIIVVQTVLQSAWGCCISGNLVESVPHSARLSLSPFLSFLLSLRLFDEDIRMQTPTGPAFSFFSPVIRAPLSTRHDLGRIKMFSTKTIWGNFSDGQVYVKGNRRIERER